MFLKRKINLFPPFQILLQQTSTDLELVVPLHIISSSSRSFSCVAHTQKSHVSCCCCIQIILLIMQKHTALHSMLCHCIETRLSLRLLFVSTTNFFKNKKKTRASTLFWKLSTYTNTASCFLSCYACVSYMLRLYICHATFNKILFRARKSLLISESRVAWW